MSGRLSKWFEVCARYFTDRDQAGALGAWCDEDRALDHVHRDWLAASRLFDFTTEPELVDYAIYSLKAAEKQYVYLWKRARESKGGE